MVTLSEFHHYQMISKTWFEPEIVELRGYPSFSLVEFYDVQFIVKALLQIRYYNSWKYTKYNTPQATELWKYGIR